jgi:hypothetical protein
VVAHAAGRSNQPVSQFDIALGLRRRPAGHCVGFAKLVYQFEMPYQIDARIKALQRLLTYKVYQAAVARGWWMTRSLTTDVWEQALCRYQPKARLIC